jgi:hypothetical protein
MGYSPMNLTNPNLHFFQKQILKVLIKDILVLQNISYCVSRGYRGDWMIGGTNIPILYTANNGSTYSIPPGVNQSVSVGLAYNTDLEIHVSVSSNADDFPAVIQYGDNSMFSNASGSIFLSGNAVSYANGIFTAVGYHGYANYSIITSSDGATWTSADLSGETNTICVTYGNGRWFAYGSNSHMLYYSDDNWTTISSNSGPLDVLTGITVIIINITSYLIQYYR